LAGLPKNGQIPDLPEPEPKSGTSLFFYPEHNSQEGCKRSFQPRLLVWYRKETQLVMLNHLAIT